MGLLTLIKKSTGVIKKKLKYETDRASRKFAKKASSARSSEPALVGVKKSQTPVVEMRGGCIRQRRAGIASVRFSKCIDDSASTAGQIRELDVRLETAYDDHKCGRQQKPRRVTVKDEEHDLADPEFPEVERSRYGGSQFSLNTSAHLYENLYTPVRFRRSRSYASALDDTLGDGFSTTFFEELDSSGSLDSLYDTSELFTATKSMSRKSL